jgi:hypothetical protein
MFGTTVTNKNLIQEEVKKGLNSGNACYHSVQNLLASRLLSKNKEIRICKTIFLPVILYWGKPEGRIPLGRQNVDGWTILKWILER